MKKLIALATLLFAFTVTANAQDKKVLSPTDAAKKDISALTSKIQIDDQLKTDLTALMVMKHEQIDNNAKLTSEDREKYARMIEAKLSSSLSEAQRKTVMNDSALLKQLTQ